MDSGPWIQHGHWNEIITGIIAVQKDIVASLCVLLPCITKFYGWQIKFSPELTTIPVSSLIFNVKSCIFPQLPLRMSQRLLPPWHLHQVLKSVQLLGHLRWTHVLLSFQLRRKEKPKWVSDMSYCSSTGLHLYLPLIGLMTLWHYKIKTRVSTQYKWGCLKL